MKATLIGLCTLLALSAIVAGYNSQDVVFIKEQPQFTYSVYSGKTTLFFFLGSPKLEGTYEDYESASKRYNEVYAKLEAVSTEQTDRELNEKGRIVRWTTIN